MSKKNTGALAGILTAALLLALLLAPLLTGVAAAAEIEGKIKSVDSARRSITLENGTLLVISPSAVVDDHRLLQPGAEIRASFEERDGQKVVTKLESAR